MSYTIDVYRGDIKPEKSWAKFALYISYFPQLIAGPIVRASKFLPQLNSGPQISTGQIEVSLFQIFRGLFKKIVFADFLAYYADYAFDTPGFSGWIQSWIGIYAFCFQIYFDFSGYSDIAIGCAGLMGFKLPENFNLPYMASSFSDFWRRWHISLSTWLRDYLYIPMGGSRTNSNFKTYRNIFITMLLGGLWHGAAWNFVIWGIFHGVLLIGEKILDLIKRFNLIIKRAIIFQAVVFSWIIFRSSNIENFLELLRSLFRSSTIEYFSPGHYLAVLIILFGYLFQVISLRYDCEKKFISMPVPVKAALYAMSAAIIMIFGSGEPEAFIYFKF